MARDAEVLFEVSGELFAVPATAVAEVLPLAELATPPGLPAGVAGFLALAGAVVPVLRTARLLDLDDREPGLYAHLLLLRGVEPRFALLVDRVTAVQVVPDEDRRPVAEEATFRGCVVSEIAGLDRSAHSLSIERLLSEHERARIAAFQEAELRRRDALEAPE